jgi:aspartate aminotransferase
MLSERIKSIKPSPTLAISSKAKAMKAQGIDVVDFGAGQPDFDAPTNIKKAAIRAVEKAGSAKYTPAAGILELKEAICSKFKRDNNISYKPENVMASCGAKHVLFNITQSLLNKGDEVIIPKPYWVSYPEQVVFAEAKPVFIETDEEFRLDADKLQSSITPKTKLIIINSPNNPSGAVFGKEQLKAVADLTVDHNLYIISDEVYEKMVYGEKHYSISSFSEEVKERTFTVNAISKTYAVPGWRIGYVGGPADVIKAMTNLQSQSTSNPTSLMQYAAIEALQGSQDSVATMVGEFERRRELIVKELNKIEGVSCNMPPGSFYVFPRVPTKDSLSFANELLEKEKVALVPGSAFGIEGHVRISYATSLENIKKGVERLASFIPSYKE